MLKQQNVASCRIQYSKQAWQASRTQSTDRAPSRRTSKPASRQVVHPHTKRNTSPIQPDSKQSSARPPLAAGDQQKTAEPNRTGILGRFLPSEWPRVRYSPSLSPPPHTPFALRPGCSLGTLSEHNSQLPLEELRTWDGSTRRLSVLCFHVSNPVPLTATLLASRCLHL